MQANMRVAQSKLTSLLAAHEPTAGLYVRVHGDNLILGRQEPVEPNGQLEDDDRVRLTLLSTATYGLSIKRHTGRWERTVRAQLRVPWPRLGAVAAIFAATPDDVDRGGALRLPSGVAAHVAATAPVTDPLQRTPFAGTLEEMVDIILGCMQHLVAPY